MRSFKQLAKQSLGRVVLADDILEFHAARLLLLIDSARKSRIDGLTKLAKLDFFVRYPAFFGQASHAVGQPVSMGHAARESAMIRFHYGPWDPRYYQVIPFLEARGLIKVTEDGRSIAFAATEGGRQMASVLRGQPEYEQLRSQIESVLNTFGGKTGNQLKQLIYDVFRAEVAERKMGERIE
ncbi:MAG: hypothetical protein H0T46_19045 [Deltaproteobacteria bacterium]|nr:hypothetical protein [Deltaproteobacteria bacterium]